MYIQNHHDLNHCIAFCCVSSIVLKALSFFIPFARSSYSTGPNTSILELADSICAARMAEECKDDEEEEEEESDYEEDETWEPPKSSSSEDEVNQRYMWRESWMA